MHSLTLRSYRFVTLSVVAALLLPLLAVLVPQKAHAAISDPVRTGATWVTQDQINYQGKNYFRQNIASATATNPMSNKVRFVAPGLTYTDGNKNCPSAGPSNFYITMQDTANGFMWVGLPACFQIFRISVTNPNNTDLSGTGLKPGTAPDDQPAPTCESLLGKLGWLGCGILSWVDDAISTFIDGIENLLSVDRLYNDKNGSIYKVWASVRSIALIILVPVLLLMVIGTALDFGPFDPYTVKRALPRLIYAAIFIVVSWQVCTFFIDLADIVGGGVQGLIINQIPPEGRTLEGLLGGSKSGIFMGIILGTTVITAGVATAGVAIAAGVFVVLSLALSFLLAILVGYFTLIFRQVILLGLLILSPLAILSWIFPGNDKLWGFWKTAFIGLLVVYPVISGIVGLGKLMAWVVAGTG